MDWKQRVRAAFDAGSEPDEEVVDELAEHAAAAFQAALAEGRDAPEVERQLTAQIAAWARDPAIRRRRTRPSPVDPAPSSRSRLVGLAHDVRQALRLLRRQPGYSAIAILTMALGIGATTSLFSIAYGVLLKPLPWRDADRLVRVSETRRGGTNRLGAIMTDLSYLAWREHPKTIDGLAAWSPPDRVTMSSAGEPARVQIADVTASLIPMLGVRPQIGTLFTERDETVEGQRRVVISYGLWQERFGLAANVIGRTIRFDDKPYRVAAVMPKGFAFPDDETRAWTPFSVRPRPHGLSMFLAMARLKPGATPAQAAAEAMARARGVADPGIVVLAVFGSKGAIQISAVPLLESQVARVRPAILVFLIAVVLLLATAAANVTSIQLARGAARRRETAIRLALGAGAGRLVRQWLIESSILGLAGGGAGLLLAAALDRALPSLLPAKFPRLDAVSIDLRVAAFAIGVSLVATVVMGVLPAIQARRVSVVASLTEEGPPSSHGRRSRRARARALVIAGQMAIACVLLVGTALLTRSFVALLSADRGYDPANVLTATIPLPDDRYTNERRAAFMTELVERLRAMPGVSHAALTTALPLTPGDILASFPVRSTRTGTTMQAHAVSRVVSPDYFRTLGIRLVDGRVFDESDTAASERVVVVNKAFVREYLRPHPVGDKLYDDSPERKGPRIIGVIENVHHRSVTDPPAAEIYATCAQAIDSLGFGRLMLAVRTVGDPAAFAPTVRAIVRQHDPSMALDSVVPMEDLFRDSVAEPRLYSVLLAALATLALVIAGVGLFSVLIHSVGQRSREIGVRAALGARPFDIVGLVVRQAMVIAVGGLAVGLGVAFALVKSLSTFLYGVTPYDTVSFVAVPLVLLLVAGVASAVPARRAARLDPVRVLRA